MTEQLNNKVKLAVFDFDGTLIPSQSGFKLAVQLSTTGRLSKLKTARLILWGLRYKLHLPYKEWVARQLIFSAFKGVSEEEANNYIDSFYENKIDTTVRSQVLRLAEKTTSEGCENLILSAAFTSTLDSFRKRHHFPHMVGTEMEVDEKGCYTGNVKGYCVAGQQKIQYLKNYADSNFGKNNWEIEYAFADHYTDKDLLDMANKVYVVHPDRILEKYAKKQNWNILK